VVPASGGGVVVPDVPVAGVVLEPVEPATGDDRPPAPVAAPDPGSAPDPLDGGLPAVPPAMT